MKIPALLVGSLVLGQLLFSAQPLRAQANACALLKPADLTTLLGGTPIAKPTGSGCGWTAPGRSKKLIAAIITVKLPGVTTEMAYQGAREEAGKEFAVTDEPGMGEKAFSSLQSFGVVMFILKRGRMLQLQYWTDTKGMDTQGTAKDLAVLRPVAKKAIAAL